MYFLSSLHSERSERIDSSVHYNYIYLILTRTPEFISNIEVLPDHFDSDHWPVAFVIKMHSGRPHQSAPRLVYNFKKANFPELNELYIKSCSMVLCIPGGRRGYLC